MFFDICIYECLYVCVCVAFLTWWEYSFLQNSLMDSIADAKDVRRSVRSSFSPSARLPFMGRRHQAKWGQVRFWFLLIRWTTNTKWKMIVHKLSINWCAFSMYAPNISLRFQYNSSVWIGMDIAANGINEHSFEVQTCGYDEVVLYIFVTSDGFELC